MESQEDIITGLRNEIEDLKGKVEELKKELVAIGAYWRADWSDFDGRTLCNQMKTVINNFEKQENIDEFRKMREEQRRYNES